jgi:hypothetical protein
MHEKFAAYSDVWLLHVAMSLGLEYNISERKTIIKLIQHTNVE